MPKQRNESAPSSADEPPFSTRPLGPSEERGAAGTEAEVRLRIVEEPLTAHNVAIVFTALTDLYTKLVLLKREMVGDLVYFNQTHDPSYYVDTPLIISSMTQNSPVSIVLNVGPAIGKALESIIDAVTLTPARLKAAKLANELIVQRAHAQRAEARARGVNLEAASHLALEQARVEYEREALKLERERLELHEQRLRVTLQTARMITDMMAPKTAADAREMIAQSLLPEIMQLRAARGLIVDRDHPRKLA